MGRPIQQTAPSLSIYHPIFATFRKLCASSDLIPTASEYDNARSLIEASIGSSAGGVIRGGVTNKIETLLRAMGATDLRDDPSNNSRVIHAKLKTGEMGYVALAEWETDLKDDGNYGSVVELGARKYVELWANEKVAHVRNVCCCPTFILLFAGYFMAIYGGVFVDGFIVQPLTDFIDLAGDALYHDRVLRISQVFVALSRCLDELRSFYGNLESSECPLPTRHVPAFQSFLVLSGDTRRQIEYIDKFTPDTTYTFVERMMYRAKLGEKEVLVKFCPTYNIEAHRHLSEHKLAPEVHHHEVLEGGIHVVVMEHIQGRILCDVKVPYKQWRSTLGLIFVRARQAMKMLHDHGWVFGDIRQANIVIPDTYSARPDLEADPVRLKDRARNQAGS